MEKTFIIGKTKSGKKVYSSFDHEAHKNFTRQDHRDAAVLHTKAMTRKGKNRPNDEQHTYHSQQHEKHDQAFYDTAE